MSDDYLNNYQDAARRTGRLPEWGVSPHFVARLSAVLHRERNACRDALTNAALGLVGELGEYCCDPTDEEAGDVLWYCAELARFCGIELADAQAVSIIGETDPHVALINAANAAEVVKKAVFHGKPLDVPLVGVCIGEIVDVLSTRHDLEAVAVQNIAKLRERYPAGFVEGGGVR